MANFLTKLLNIGGLFSRKSYSYAGAVYGYESFDMSGRTLAPRKALNYYTSVAPLFTAINSISMEVGALNLTLYKADSDEVVFDHEALKLLKQPNADMTQYELMTQLSSFYKLTGNAFIIATGNINKAPLEIYSVNPSAVKLKKDEVDGFIRTIEVTSDSGVTESFHRDEKGSRFRYYNKTEDAEIWHIKSFNPFIGAGDPWGFSELTPIVYELEQYIESSIHNLSLLKRGAKPSGAIKVPEGLTDAQFARNQEQLERFWSGSSNAGRVLMLENGEFINMSQSNVDMDFASLKASITATIYTALKIPLPLVAGEYTSYNNMETAKLNFYDNCVLPTAKRILEELSVFLLHRYGKASDSMELRFDQDDIEALEPRRNQQLVSLKDSGVLSINELRAKLGYESVEGGDEVYIQNNQVPVGVDITPELVKNIDNLLKDNKNQN